MAGRERGVELASSIANGLKHHQVFFFSDDAFENYCRSKESHFFQREGGVKEELRYRKSLD